MGRRPHHAESDRLMADGGLGAETRLAHVGRPGSRSPGFVNPPVHRGSTQIYATCADRLTQSPQVLGRGALYGIYGSPTHHALEDLVAEIEGGTRCQLVSSGLAAVTTALLAYLGAGDHLLAPDSLYGPSRDFCEGMLTRLGVAVTFYDPTVDEVVATALMRPNTRVLLAESPGSHSFEVQDVPALTRVAHAHGAKLLLDNTWGVHFFQPFIHGVDVSIQALTKYVSGHSDLLLGGITVATDPDWERIRLAAEQLGQYASPDDCWLALRGARTLGVRMARQMQSGLEVASWLAARPEVAQVLHPALPGAPGHALWRRDFTGASSLFGVVLQPEYSPAASFALMDSLTLFGIGSSWGGYESLAIPSTGQIKRTVGTGRFAGPLMRLHIGLEDPADLIADLAHGLEVLRAHD
jgi:cystathionine beta-lyase